MIQRIHTQSVYKMGWHLLFSIRLFADSDGYESYYVSRIVSSRVIIAFSGAHYCIIIRIVYYTFSTPTPFLFSKGAFGNSVLWTLLTPSLSVRYQYFEWKVSIEPRFRTLIKKKKKMKFSSVNITVSNNNNNLLRKFRKHFTYLHIGI